MRDVAADMLTWPMPCRFSAETLNKAAHLRERQLAPLASAIAPVLGQRPEPDLLGRLAGLAAKLRRWQRQLNPAAAARARAGGGRRPPGAAAGQPPQPAEFGAELGFREEVPGAGAAAAQWLLEPVGPHLSRQPAGDAGGCWDGSGVQRMCARSRIRGWLGRGGRLLARHSMQ